MPNKKEHIAGAILFGLLYSILTLKKGLNNEAIFVETTLRSGISILGGLAPDVIEPPVSPRHRGFWHYIVGPCSGLFLLFLKPNSDSIQKAIGSFCSGYFSHWLLDIT